MLSKAELKKQFLLANPPRGAADASEINDNKPDPDPAPDPAPVAPTPDPTKYVSLETFQSEMGKLKDAIISSRSTPTPTDTNVNASDPWNLANLPEPTDDDDAITAARKIAKRELAPLVHEFRSALQQRDDVNFSALEELGNEMLAPKMPYYNKYKAEVDQIVNGMAPNIRARSSSKLMAYRMVMANHIDEIVEEKVEGKLREKVKGGEPTKPIGGKHTRVFDVKKGIPTPQDLGYTEDQIASVEERFGDWDHFAVKVSGGRFKNYAEYAKKRAQQLGFTIAEDAKSASK